MLASWLPEDPDSDRHRAWARTFHAVLEPHALGTYVDFLSGESAMSSPASTATTNLMRLRALKTEFDPTDVFHHNANNTPS